MDVKRKKGKGAVGVLIVCITVFAMSTPVFAAQGKIRIELEEFKQADSERANVLVDLYQVGTVDEYGIPKFDENFYMENYPQDGAALDQAEEKLANLVDEKIMSGKTDDQGVLCFDVEQGVYLICVHGEESYGKVSPFLVNLPYYENVNGEMQGPIHDVNVKPKASPIEESNTSEKSENPQKETANKVRTGDDSKGIRYFVTAVLAALVGTISIYNRRKNR